MIEKLLLSVVAGVLVGLDREKKKKPTGIRTSAMVCMGCCLFTILAQMIPSSYIDRGHLIANLPQGIGMICALAVIADTKRNHIIGLTSAAILWVLAAVGVSIGLGFYGIAFEAIVLILTVVYVTDFLRRKQVFKGEK